MGWYLAVLIKDCRYFCCCSKGKFFFGQFQSSEEVYEIEAFVFPGVILFLFLFKSFFCSGYGISFRFFWVLAAFVWFIYLKAHMKLNGKSDSMNWNRGILRKTKIFYYWLTNGFFYLLTFNFRADIMTRYIFNQVRFFFCI